MKVFQVYLLIGVLIAHALAENQFVKINVDVRQQKTFLCQYFQIIFFNYYCMTAKCVQAGVFTNSTHF